MKIQCDVCDKAEASVFCPADEAALCHGCDRSIHHANKLAGKHTRFSLLHPCSKEVPLCDICQDRRAFLFCKEERAILCRECDIPIHKANELTQKHSRFLLTGVKLSAAALAYQASSSTVTCTEAGRLKSKSSVKLPRSASDGVFGSPSMVACASCKVEDSLFTDTASVSASSISEYLIETIPGWCVEDLLEDSLFPKNKDHQSTVGDTFADSCIFPRPSVNVASGLQPQCAPTSSQMVTVNGFLNELVENTPPKAVVKDSWYWLDDCFTVPQISPHSPRKRRHF